MSKTRNNRKADKTLLIQKINEAYSLAYNSYTTNNNSLPDFSKEISPRFLTALEEMAKNCEKASSAYLNIVTSLTIKCGYGDNVDIRYHQAQIQDRTDRPAGFNFRNVSQDYIFPWMEEHEFHGAKSGWQTRTFERPKPYLLDYDENIEYVKNAFLICYDEVEENHQNALLGLAFLLWRRIQLREQSEITLSVPNIQDVIQISKLFERHFFYEYKKNTKGTSRLPVLALYAIYSVLLRELNRFAGKELRPLESHSAADSQTGAIGDIEVIDSSTNNIFEAVEVKHGIKISKTIIDIAKQKISGHQVDRYYILTTHAQHEPTPDIEQGIEDIKRLLGCQLIVNGVIPTIRYYLRLMANPNAVFPEYVKLLKGDKSISFEHRDVWNKIVLDKI